LYNLYVLIPILVKRTAPTINRWGSAAEATHNRRATRRKRERKRYSEV